MTAQTLPDNPNYCFVPACDIGDEAQQIRIVFEDTSGYGPTALVALKGLRQARVLAEGDERAIEGLMRERREAADLRVTYEPGASRFATRKGRGRFRHGGSSTYNPRRNR